MISETRRANAYELQFLDDRIGVYEQFVEGAILARPTYYFVYAAIRDRKGTFRLIYRGTGIHDWWFEVDETNTRAGLQRKINELRDKFKLSGPRLARDLRVFHDARDFAAAVAQIPEADGEVFSEAGAD